MNNSTSLVYLDASGISRCLKEGMCLDAKGLAHPQGHAVLITCIARLGSAHQS